MTTGVGAPVATLFDAGRFNRAPHLFAPASLPSTWLAYHHWAVERADSGRGDVTKVIPGVVTLFYAAGQTLFPTRWVRHALDAPVGPDGFGGLTRPLPGRLPADN